MEGAEAQGKRERERQKYDVPPRQPADANSSEEPVTTMSPEQAFPAFLRESEERYPSCYTKGL